MQANFPRRGRSRRPVSFVARAILCSALALAFVALALVDRAEARTRTTFVERVIDGDTFVIAGGARVRVANFDTPELRHYDCLEERALARTARSAADGLLRGRRVTLEISGEDRYRRLVADVTVHQGPATFDFAERMVEIGHGAPWDYGHEPQPNWCPELAAEAGPSARRATEAAPDDQVEARVETVEIPASARANLPPTDAWR